MQKRHLKSQYDEALKKLAKKEIDINVIKAIHENNESVNNKLSLQLCWF